MKTTALFLALCIPALAQDRKPLKLDSFQLSRASVLAGAGADVASSWGRYELNPVLGRGKFGARQAVTSLAITGVLVWAEGPLVRNHPSLKRTFTVVNFVVSGARFGVAVRNGRMQ